MRNDWEEIKINVMLECVRAKFYQNRDLAGKLVETDGLELIEGNRWHDNIWGNCSCSRCQHIEGKNLLGKILMRVREEVVTEQAWEQLMEKTASLEIIADVAQELVDAFGEEYIPAGDFPPETERLEKYMDICWRAIKPISKLKKVLKRRK